MTTWLSPKNLSYDAIVQHFPVGAAWFAIRDMTKVAGQLVYAISRFFEDGWSTLGGLARELDYRTGEQFLSEWEEALGLPDQCLPSDGSLADRRKWIAFRLDKRRWSRTEDWHELAALYGLTIRITPGWKVQKPALYAALYPKHYNLFPKLGRFRVYIDFLDQQWRGYPYDDPVSDGGSYPIWYGIGATAPEKLICLIERVKPANVIIIWNEFPEVPPNGTGSTFSDDFDLEFS